MKRVACIALLIVCAAGAAVAILDAQVAPPSDALTFAGLRLLRDQVSIEAFRPSYPFWRHVFMVPDGSILFGSAVDGRLLTTIPARGGPRREDVAADLERESGPVVHNPSRGSILLGNVDDYSQFLEEWRTIYERFAVPGDIGLAQALVESGLSGTIKSEAGAIGFCQWLRPNWARLDRLSPRRLEAGNQTTQAPYCAAYLTILSIKYGSFIPALSEHHAGGANIGRVVVNGQRLGGVDVREQYFLGAEFVRDVRALAPGEFSDIYGTYGPRSSLYAEMIFGNVGTIAELLERAPRQSKIYAMRAARALTLSEVVRRSRLSVREVQRFNPALVKRVPAGATVYLPRPVAALGRDVSFWHQPPSATYQAALDEFVLLDPSLEEWHSHAFDRVLDTFRKRFAATRTEEGSVMATTLAFVLEDRRASKEAAILADFQESDRIRRLFDRARSERAAHEASLPAATGALDSESD
jgi:hypothetical protein